MFLMPLIHLADAPDAPNAPNAPPTGLPPSALAPFACMLVECLWCTLILSWSTERLSTIHLSLVCSAFEPILYHFPRKHVSNFKDHIYSLSSFLQNSGIVTVSAASVLLARQDRRFNKCENVRLAHTFTYYLLHVLNRGVSVNEPSMTFCVSNDCRLVGRSTAAI